MNTTTLRAQGKAKQSTVTRNKRSFVFRVDFITFVVILVIIGVFFPRYVLSSGQFSVQRVLFEGAYMVTEKEVLAAANITDADNTIFLNSEAIQSRVEALPYVKHCEVKRMSQNEVLLRILERNAVASIMVNNTLFEIDREFVVLRELSPFTPHTGPLITNLPGIVAVAPGMQLHSEALAKALELWDVFTTFPFYNNLVLSEISAESETHLRLFFNDLPYEMRWGRSDFETQASRLQILWQEAHGELPCEAYLDLRFDADIVCK